MLHDTFELGSAVHNAEITKVTVVKCQRDKRLMDELLTTREGNGYGPMKIMVIHVACEQLNHDSGCVESCPSLSYISTNYI